MSDQEQAASGAEGDPAAGQAAAVLRLLGLSRRAGRLEVGFSAVQRLVNRFPDAVVLMTRDMGASQRHRTEAWQVARTIVLPLSSAELGEAMGRETVAVVALRDPGFAKGLLGILEPGS